MSEISADFILNGGFDYLPVTINPFDAKTDYFWSKEGQRLVSINLHNGELMIHNNQLDGRSDGPIIIPVKDPRAMISLESTSYMEYINTANLDPFILPQWLHRIPVSIKQPTTTDQQHESKDIPSQKIVHGKAVTTAISTDGASAIEL
ncbi:unnamed protein product [Eruca vesicaria subsp. sativa]|uniref:F-box protein At3g26010-like beta-propeller domain-containing protein n=1 Tax=Eruca vesicaria subsp. sativa TaxID=29727 RepID=A0ABC8J633_ERUVS|nr:unnamed protein product [Eruca vesicaria subsp. sativa]